MARDNASQSRPISLASTTSSAAAHQDGGISCPGLYAYGLACYRRVFDALPSTASRTLIVVSSTDHSRGGASQAVLAANLAYRASFVRFAQSRGYDVSLREPGRGRRPRLLGWGRYFHRRRRGLLARSRRLELRAWWHRPLSAANLRPVAKQPQPEARSRERGVDTVLETRSFCRRDVSTLIVCVCGVCV